MKQTSKLTVAALIALIGVCALAWCVGHFARRPDKGLFDWDLALIFGTALGTTLLAITTGALAFLTSRDVSATRELAALTRRDQKRRVRPQLLLTSLRYSGGSSDGVSSGHLAVKVENAGLGPALVVVISTRYTGELKEGVEIHDVLVQNLPAGGSKEVQIEVSLGGNRHDALRAEHFEFRATYLDLDQDDYDVRLVAIPD
jgi:hypothetical protein